MKTTVLLCLSTFISIASLAADANPPPRLMVELRDGSHLVGKPLTDTLSLHSDTLGVLKLAWSGIRSLEYPANTAMARLTATNGDAFSARIAADTLAVETGFGNSDLPVKSIRSIKVTPPNLIEVVTPVAAGEAGSRLTIELRDGSHFVGKGLDETLDFHSTGLGDLKLGWSGIRLIEFVSTNGDVARLTTTNGDVYEVKFTAPSVVVETSFGKVELPVARIKNLRVSALVRAGRLKEGLIGWWSSDGNAVDSVAGNNGTLRNVSFTPGVAGQSFAFAPDNFPYGTWTGVQIPDQPAYALTQSLTIQCWIRPRGNGYVIFFRGDHRSGLDPYALSMDGHLNLVFSICADNANSASVHTPVGLGSWIHVAGVLDDRTGTMSLYTNGVLAAQTVTTVRPFGPLLANESPGVGIGNVNDGGNNFPFSGDIDEVGLYDRALSADEVNALYHENAANAGGQVEPFPPRAMPTFGTPRGLRGPLLD